MTENLPLPKKTSMTENLPLPKKNVNDRKFAIAKRVTDRKATYGVKFNDRLAVNAKIGH